MSENKIRPSSSCLLPLLIRRIEQGGLIRVGDVELDWQSHRVTRGSRLIVMTTMQVRLLRTLMLAPGRVLSRKEVLATTWPHGVFIGERTVDVHIVALRKALCASGGSDLIRTIRGRGYSIVADDDPGRLPEGRFHEMAAACPWPSTLDGCR